MEKQVSSPEPGFSLVDVGKLAEPANTFITRVSDLIGGFLTPYQIKRVAGAKADAALTEAQSQIEITELHRRAARRWIEEEARNQKNMEDIAANAVPLLQETANPEEVDGDWMVHFFDRCRKVSSQQMQQLWSRALAGEANNPGSFSKRTITALAGLEDNEAQWFTNLCGFAVVIGRNSVPLVFDESAEIYRRHQVDFSTLSDLESIGMIRLGGAVGFRLTGLSRRMTVHYFGERWKLRLPKESDNEIEVGKVVFTRVGRDLLPICGGKTVEGFRQYLETRWSAYSPEMGGG